MLESNLKCCNNKLCTQCEEAVAEKHEACPFCRAFLTTPKQQERKRQQQLQAQQQQQQGRHRRFESSPEGWSDDDYSDSEDDYSDDDSGGFLGHFLPCSSAAAISFLLMSCPSCSTLRQHALRRSKVTARLSYVHQPSLQLIAGLQTGSGC